MLVTVTLNLVYVLTVAAKRLVEKPTLTCPECGGELTCLGFVPSAPRRLVEFDVDINKSSEAKPFSKPSANVERQLNKSQSDSRKASDAGVAVA